VSGGADFRSDPAEPLDYRSTFAQWHERASVRSRPARVLRPPPADCRYFPPELFPVVGHPRVRALGEPAVRRLLVQRLYGYLLFTVELEETAVVPVTSRLGRGRLEIDVPDRMRADAFKITTDEAYHSLFTYDLIAQVADETGVPPLLPAEPPFLRELAATRTAGDPVVRRLGPLLVAMVSETLISRVLSDLPGDARLPSAVRAVVRDHADDERRHHAYFRVLLRQVWPQLGQAEQRVLGALVPRLVRGFLAPDLAHTRRLLGAAGLRPGEADEVLAEVYTEPRVNRDVAHAARRTVRYFEEVGALEHGEVREEFARAQLLAEVGT